MDRYSIIGQGAAAPAASPAPVPDAKVTTSAKEPLRFPAEDNGKSLVAMAERDLEAALQLLVERTQYITGASGAAIALLENGEMICRAASGPSAPEVGSQLQLQAGLTGESVRLKKVLQCDDAERDLRVNRESCRALGVNSVMVMPLMRDHEVFGVFELLADRTYAFEERDITALNHMSEMVLTALEHAEAAKRAFHEIAAKSEELESVEKPLVEVENPIKPQPITKPTEKVLDAKSVEVSTIRANVNTCEACGFPVSGVRKLCVDCEEARHAGGTAEAANSAGAPDLFSLAAPVRNESWFDRHMYTIGTIVMVGLTVLALYLKFR